MKHPTFVVSALALAVAAAPVFAKDYVVALSPYVEPQAAKAEATQVLQWATALEPGDHITLLDGYKLETIGTFNVPADVRYSSAKARLNANQSAVAALLRFADTAKLPVGDGQPSVAGALRLPQLLRHTASNVTHSGALDVVVIGSPVYDDPADNAFSMADGGIIPSDGHLVASRSNSPFGTNGQESLLSGLRVHIAYPANTMQYGDQYAYMLERFWGLHAQLQGGTLATFTGDRATALSRSASGAAAPSQEYQLNNSDKLEMMILRQEAQVRTIFDRDLATSAPARIDLEGARDVQIGLSWDCSNCDLDLYAKPYPDSAPLYFGNTSTPEGHYWKDFRISPQSIRGFEIIDLTVPLDLRNLQVIVNHFGGKAEADINAELRITFNGQTYGLAFQLPAGSGDKGAGAVRALQEGKPGSEATAVVDPLSVVGLR